MVQARGIKKEVKNLVWSVVHKGVVHEGKRSGRILEVGFRVTGDVFWGDAKINEFLKVWIHFVEFVEFLSFHEED
jgi:hypothetical protein